MLVKYESEKRGDTIVEVMFALAVFSLIAIISIALMNMGVRQAEGSLEAVTARNELNAQAEALRFIHSSYISEMTLPEYDSEKCKFGDSSTKCQQYATTWNDIVSNAVTSDVAEKSGLLDLGHKVMEGGCNQLYEIGDNNQSPLGQVGAFVINTRNVNADHTNRGSSTSRSSYVGIKGATSSMFQRPELSPRLIYTYTGSTNGSTTNDNISDSTTDTAASFNQVTYDQLLYAEGIWVFAVKPEDNNPAYYDFYIESSWNPPNSGTPSTLDTVIRLYNP